MDCSLDYIPKYLHTNNKPIINKFNIGEELYFRCTSTDCVKPYSRKNLYDISHNRNFNNSEDYPAVDVLYNIDKDDERQHYDDQEFITLKIRDINGKHTFVKNIKSEDDISINIQIILLHKPVPCMYTHSAFEILLNNLPITKENYNSTLGKKNRTYKNLRYIVRQELSLMIQTGIVDSAEETLIIDNP